MSRWYSMSDADTRSDRRAVIIITGVFARGVRPQGHAPFQQLERSVIGPLKEMGFRISLWGFNNIPPTIDGDLVPADGAKSYFPEFDLYEEWKQENIDDSEWARKRSLWLWENAFADDAWHTRFGPTSRYHANMVRLNFLEKAAIEALQAQLDSGELAHDDLVVLVYPEIMWTGSRTPAGVDMTQLLATATKQAWVGAHWNGTTAQPVHNGRLVGRVDSILRWWHQREAPSRRWFNYEQWYADGLRGMHIENVCRSSCRRNDFRLKGCKPAH
jgi:hypothetical protein